MMISRQAPIATWTSCSNITQTLLRDQSQEDEEHLNLSITIGTRYFPPRRYWILSNRAWIRSMPLFVCWRTVHVSIDLLRGLSRHYMPGNLWLKLFVLMKMVKTLGCQFCWKINYIWPFSIDPLDTTTTNWGPTWKFSRGISGGIEHAETSYQLCWVTGNEGMLNRGTQLILLILSTFSWHHKTG